MVPLYFYLPALVEIHRNHKEKYFLKFCGGFPHLHPFLLPKLTEASKAKKNYSKFSTMTMPKTTPVQNLLRYISFKSKIFGHPGGIR